MKTPLQRFEIIDHHSPRPDAAKIVFCDGTEDRLFRADSDLELSHWRPNHTPTQYRAGTSTEICFRFLDQPCPGDWIVAVNNHVDVDGMLSVYTLLHSDHAENHRQTIIQAAEIGDFWGWGDTAAQRVFQGLTRLMKSAKPDREIFAEAFRRIPGLIDGTDEEIADIDSALQPLRRGVEWLERGEIIRQPLHDRLTQYIVPLSIAGTDDERAAYIPEFNEQISEQAVLWPQVRHRWDAERLCLVSTERTAGWFHDLWAPGYLWADTEGRWQIPGLNYHDGMSRYDLEVPTLIEAFRCLQRAETGFGHWCLGGTSSLFGQALQKQFPVIGRVLNQPGKPTVSQLSPDEVADCLRQFPA